MLKTRMLSEANRSVAWYPFDPYLRSLRHYVRQQIAQLEARDAMGREKLLGETQQETPR
jgi:hypothetical protein